jgi:hypothetical protein
MVMAKRHKLADLVKQETEKSEPELTDLQSSELTDLQSNRAAKSQSAEVTESQPDRATESQSIKIPNSQTANLQTLELTESQTAESPKYLTLIRKETRLREDQIDKLTAIARKLNRAKRGGERITENTLIRVAVDLLLDRSESLSGTDEAELLNSLGLEVTE